MSAVVEHHHAHGPANRGRRVLQTAAPLFVRFPDSLATTAVVVLHDAAGLTDAVEDCCRELARLGHLAVAPYFYYETGGREFATAEPGVARAAWARLRPADLAADVAGALDYLERRCGIRGSATALLGIGSAAWLAAADHKLGAAIGADHVHGISLDSATVAQLVTDVHRALSPTIHRREQE